MENKKGAARRLEGKPLAASKSGKKVDHAARVQRMHEGGQGFVGEACLGHCGRPCAAVLLLGRGMLLLCERSYVYGHAAHADAAIAEHFTQPRGCRFNRLTHRGM